MRLRHIHFDDTLPDYPIVEADKDEIFITWDDGSRHYWGKEDTERQAAQVAREMEQELKAIQYIKEVLEYTVEGLLDTLHDWGLENDLDDILFLSHRQFIESQRFESLDQWLNNTVKRFRVKSLEVKDKRLTIDEVRRGLDAIESLQETLRTLKGALIAEGARRTPLCPD